MVAEFGVGVFVATGSSMVMKSLGVARRFL